MRVGMEHCDDKGTEHSDTCVLGDCNDKGMVHSEEKGMEHCDEKAMEHSDDMRQGAL